MEKGGKTCCNGCEALKCQLAEISARLAAVEQKVAPRATFSEAPQQMAQKVAAPLLIVRHKGTEKRRMKEKIVCEIVARLQEPRKKGQKTRISAKEVFADPKAKAGQLTLRTIQRILEEVDARRAAPKGSPNSEMTPSQYASYAASQRSQGWG